MKSSTRKRLGSTKAKQSFPEPAANAPLLSKIKGWKFCVVGIGGIGSSLSSYLGRFLWSQQARAFNVSLDLIDGDHYELKNKTRMLFASQQAFGSKTVVKATELASEFGDRLTVRPIPEFVTPANTPTLIGERYLVFLAVDNFKSRKIISDYCETLRNVVLISGGNDGVEDGQDGTFGNVQIFERKRGRNLKNPITRFHPEIMFPADKVPSELSCEDLALTSTPQLLLTNLAVASAMLNTFYAWLCGKVDYEEIYLDVLSGTVRPAQRKMDERESA